MSRPRNTLYLAVLGLGFLFSSGMWLWNSIRFQGIESWPQVPATEFVIFADAIPTHGESRFGSSWGIIPLKNVSYQYRVDGVEHSGYRATADGYDINDLDPHFGTRAYYKPEDPSLAVLWPRPYRGSSWFWLSVFLGSFILFRIGFNLTKLPRKT